MLRSIDKKIKIIFYIFLILFLSTFNNTNIQELKKNFFLIENIKINGLNEKLTLDINSKLEKYLSSNLLLLNKEFIQNDMNEFPFIESYTIFKKYPSQIILNIKETELISKTFDNNKIEYIGSNNCLSDLEVIILAEEFLKDLKIRKKLVLEINSLGNEISRRKYNESLKNYLQENFSQLSELSKERLKKNPLRVLDSKEENDIKIVQNSPSIIDFLDYESKSMFEDLINGLEKLSINYNINRYLVRGLDY